MLVKDLNLMTSDGVTLGARRFGEPGPEGSVLIMGGWGIQQRFYKRFASWLTTQGYQVLSFDYRGIGASLDRPIRQMNASSTDWGTFDVNAAFAELYAMPGPHYAVAHSFGGQVLGLTDQAAQLDGIYMVGSQLAHHRLFSGWYSPGLWVVSHVLLPLIPRLFGYVPAWAGLGEDIPKHAALEWGAWMRSPNYLIDHHTDAAARYQRFPAPVAMVGFSDDTYAPPAGVQALAGFMPQGTDLRIVRPEDWGQERIGHFGFFRPHADARMWRDCRQALQGFAPPNQSAAVKRATTTRVVKDPGGRLDADRVANGTCDPALRSADR